jgi:hypothetical protein
MVRANARQQQDAGTPYAAALAGDHRYTLEQRAMAIWCDAIVGRSAAFSPRLVWQGAVAAGLAPTQLYKAYDAGDWDAIEVLMFADPRVPKERRALAALAKRLPR